MSKLLFPHILLIILMQILTYCTFFKSFLSCKNRKKSCSFSRLIYCCSCCYQLLMIPLIMSVLYVWAQINKDVIVSFWFGTRFKVPHVLSPVLITSQIILFFVCCHSIVRSHEAASVFGMDCHHVMIISHHFCSLFVQPSYYST